MAQLATCPLQCWTYYYCCRSALQSNKQLQSNKPLQTTSNKQTTGYLPSLDTQLPQSNNCRAANKIVANSYKQMVDKQSANKQ